ncbi:MAG: hypothetical protein GX825_07495 [Syntrophomonadaceae bacterium]|nr:hypothetical protein [Syntrophomonadaceae bacterium]
MAVCYSEAESEQLRLPVRIPGASGIHLWRKLIGGEMRGWKSMLAIPEEFQRNWLPAEGHIIWLLQGW